jgi:aromatic ring-opening dioxygenase catalytic subunit (LigB family)
MSNPEKLPIFFIPHGGGPWHVMADAFGDPVGYGLLRDYLIKLGQEYSLQLSLVNTLDPSTHIAIGKAIEPLRSEGVLIVGSGMSYHNMRGFMSGSPMAAQVSKQFDDWLMRAVENEENEKRNEMLTNWLKAPRALEAHPRSEHLVPLFVASGAAGTDRGHQDYAGKLLSVSVSGYKFG